jgi:hypothetical protein
MLVVLSSHVINGMFHDVSIIPMSNMLLFLIAGVCQGVAGRPETSSCEGSTPAYDGSSPRPALSQ